MASRSATEALRDLYSGREDHLAPYTGASGYPADTVGLIIGDDGRSVAPDPRGALDTLTGNPDIALSLPRAVRMLHRPQGAANPCFGTPRLSEDLGLVGGGVDGAALFFDGVVVRAALHRVVTKG